MKNKTNFSKKLFSFILVVCLLLSFAVSVSASEKKIDTDPDIAYSNCFAHAESDASEDSSVTVGSRFLELIFGKKEKRQPSEDIYLCPGGDAFGVKICGSGVTVSKIITELSEGTLRVDDRILSINNTNVSTISEVKEILNSSGGKSLDFEILRNGKKIHLDITPRCAGGEYHLGVILTDGATGIGTITYYDPETLTFGGLGHGICSKDGSEVLKMTRGEVTGVILAGAKRGEPANPGELRGVLTDKILGTVDKNTSCGVFGTLSRDAVDIMQNSSKSSGASATLADKGTDVITKENKTEALRSYALPIAKRDEVCEGEATIISTVKSGKKAEYKIEIYDIDRDSTESKSFKIRVTDDTLLALTGGIVRGMSGSPIIQDGKLVGAVTHVMVSDPTEGYGIFIENMLSAAEGQVQPKAA